MRSLKNAKMLKKMGEKAAKVVDVRKKLSDKMQEARERPKKMVK